MHPNAEPATMLLRTAMLCIATLSASKAAAQTCAATVRAAAGTVILNYDPFDGDRETFDLSLELVNQGESACEIALAAASQTAARPRQLSNGAEFLTYELRLGGQLLENDALTPQGRIILPAGQGKTATAILRFDIPAGLIAAAGQYDDLITLRAYSIGEGPSEQLGEDRLINVSAFVPARAQVNLAGSDSKSFGAMSLDALSFGDLTVGAQRNAYIQVRSTAPVLISIQSENLGIMRNTALGANGQGVPYELRVEAAELDLAGGTAQIEREPPRSLAGASYAMNVRIAETEGRVAGLYEDTLTITVEPR